MAEIVIRNLRKEFGSFTAVKGSSFTIGNGEFFMLLGPSGCGKTTTLRMIAGLELPTSGEILIDGQDVSQRPASQRDIAMVFQMFALYPHMNVRKNIAYPLVSQGVSRAEVASAWPRWRVSCASSTCWTRALAAFLAATASASPLAAPSCAAPRPS